MTSVIIDIYISVFVFKLLYACIHFCRSHSTSYERAIGIAKSRDASPTTQKRKKRRKLDVDEQQQCKTDVATAMNTTNVPSLVYENITGDGHCVSKICQDTYKMDQYTCEVVQDTSELGQSTYEMDQNTSVCWSRGWFSSSWPESNNVLQHSLSAADETLIHIAQTLAQRTAELQLAELRLECSSAAKWSKLKRSKCEDGEALVSSPAGVLWSGTVKPLIEPSQATSVGKLHFYHYLL